MPRYTVLVTVEVEANTQSQAYRYIEHACKQAKQAEVVYVDAEMVETMNLDDEEEGAE